MSNSNIDQQILEEASRLLSHETEADAFVVELQNSITSAVAKTNGDQTGVVESAVELQTEEKKQIETLLQKALQHPVTLSYQVNKAVLGGVKIRVGDWVLDATLARNLNKMRDALVKGSRYGQE